MTNTDAMREAFEKENPPPIGTKYNAHNDEYDTCDEHSVLCNVGYTIRYKLFKQGWQASRQQPIALPLINTEVKGEISEQDAGIVIRAMAVVKQLCKESITAQGYAVKESE